MLLIKHIIVIDSTYMIKKNCWLIIVPFEIFNLSIFL